MNQESGSPAPWSTLPVRLEELAKALDGRGDAASAAALRDVLAAWRAEQDRWRARLGETLGVHHEINNALVGVRGNAQLLLMNPAAQQPGVRERLEVVIRESSRIQEAASRLRELKASLDLPATGRRAA